MILRLLTITVMLSILSSCALFRQQRVEHEDLVTISPAFEYEARKKVAVFPFENQERGDINRMITENFSARLVKAGFSVIDSRQLEQAARVSGITLDRVPTVGQLKTIGSELGVNTVVTGSCISPDSTIRDELNISMISARFIDVQTGETILYAVVRPDGVAPASRKLVSSVRASVMNSLFAKGNNAFDRGDMKTAISYYSSLISLDPALINALRNRGISYARISDYSKALDDFDQAIGIAGCSLLDPSTDLMQCLMKTAPYWKVDSMMPNPPPDLISDRVETAKKTVQAELFLNRGLVLYRAGNTAASVSDFDRALAAGADPATVYANRAVALVKLNKRKEALEDYDKSISASSLRPDTYYQRGLLLEKDEPDKALEDFNSAIKLDRRFAAAYSARARIEWRKDELQKAIDDYSRAIVIEPENTEYLNGRAALLLKTGNSNGAEDDYSRAIEADSLNAEALLARGGIYAAAGDDDKAGDDFKKALKTDTQSAGRAFMELGRLKDREGKYSQAVDYFTKAIDLLGKTSSAPYSQRGMTKQRLADYRGSELDISRALQISDTSGADHYNRGYSRLQMGKYRESIDDFTRAVTLTPGYQPAFNNRAYAKQLSGNYREAIEDFSRAIALEPEKDKPDGGMQYPDEKLNREAAEYRKYFTYANRGESYRALADYEKALEDFDKAVDLSPKRPEIYVQRGIALQQSGQMEKALADFNRAIALDPDSADAFYARGAWYEQKGELQDARYNYTAAIGLKPDFSQAYFSRALINMQTDHLKDGLQDMKTAARMGFKKAQDYLLTGGVEW